jgi:uncharacterized protein (DUF1330 family)
MPRILIATLTVHPDRIEAFRAYERKAAAIMERFGGRIERVVALDPDPEDHFHRELHVVSFPDDAAVAAYRNAPDFKALAAEREAAILATAIRYGTEAEGYHREQ